MALSGSYNYYPVSSFGLYVEWSATQSVTGNYSDVTQKIYLSYYTLEVESRSDSTSSINGTSETYTAPSIHDYSSGWKKKLLHTQTVRVYHNSSGVASNIPLDAAWRFGGTYSSVPISWINASTSIILNSIDRAAPTVSISTSGTTANSVTVSATASTTCDRWDYSTDNGSTWTNFSTISGTSTNTTITGLTPNTTYNIRVRARKKTNQVYGTSSASSVKTLGGSVLSSINTFTADNATAKITMSVTVYNTSYTHKLVIKNGSTTILTITGLSLSSGSNTITLTSSQRSTVLNAMSSVKDFSGTFELTTYSGSTQIGNISTKSGILVKTTAANSSPTFPGFSYRDSNNVSVAVTTDDQILIQNVSFLVVTALSATAKNGATISSYSVLAGNTPASSPNTTINVGIISEIGTDPTIAVTVTAIDSRGYSTSMTKNVPIIAYDGIRISDSFIRRLNEVEDTLQVNLDGYMSPIPNSTDYILDSSSNYILDSSNDKLQSSMIEGATKNYLKYVGYRYRRTDSSNWSEWIEVTSGAEYTDTSFEYINNELIDLSSEYSFYVEFKVEDILTYDTELFTISQGIPLMAFRRKKVGINKRDPASALDVNGDIMMNGMNVLGFITALTDSEDLNNLTSPGIYTQASSAQTSTSRHYPTAIAGFLEVIINPSGYILQRYTAYNCSGMYIRYRYNGSWHSWKSITLT